jgi:Uma2 family endonuclease
MKCEANNLCINVIINIMKEDKMVLPREKSKTYSYAEYKYWPESEQWEIIDGEPFDMSPAPGMTHQKVSGKIFQLLANYLDSKPCLVFSAPFDVFFPAEDQPEEEVNNIVQPDLSVICDESKLSEKGCTGAPDIVIEIISPSTASHDQIRKLRLYEKSGVREYWIFHPVDKIVWKYILDSKGYGKPEIFDYTSKPSFKLFPDLQLNLMSVFDIKEEDLISEPSPSSYKK